MVALDEWQRIPGRYEMTFNGKAITESLLNPGWTQYDKTCLYDTYDVTSLLQQGKNAIGLLISNGMYRVSKKERYAKFQHSFGKLQAIAKILLEYNDGSKNTFVTNSDWRSGVSPMTFSNIYGEEDWDARKEQKNWDKPGFDASNWLPVEQLDGPGGELKGITHAVPPIRAFQVIYASQQQRDKAQRDYLRSGSGSFIYLQNNGQRGSRICC